MDFTGNWIGTFLEHAADDVAQNGLGEKRRQEKIRKRKEEKHVEKRRRQEEKERRTEKNALEENNFITNINKII